MKEKDIRQDYEPQQLILYVEKEDGSYGPIQTGSYLSKNYLDDFWLKKSNLESQLAAQVMNNEVSPIYYFMTLQELSVAELASRVGVPVFRVKRHLKPSHFKNIKLKLLKRYADVFGVPVSRLLELLLYEENEGMKSFYIQDAPPTYFDIKHRTTQNPYVALTIIKKKSDDNK